MLKSLLSNTLIDYLEYILVFTIIVECNSLFTFSENYRQAPVAPVFVLISIILLSCLIVIYVYKYWLKIKSGIKCYLPILCGIYISTILFFCINVRYIEGATQVREYCVLFMIFFPLLCILFRVYGLIGKPYELFYKYSNIIWFLGLCNLMAYLVMLCNPNIIYAHLTQTRWSDLGYLRTYHNLLNVCNIEISKIRSIGGILVYRNLCFFTEPLMFSIPLVTALSTEMFLRDNKHEWSWRWPVYCVLIITSQATLGIMLMVCVCGVKMLQVIRTKRKKSLYVLIIFTVILLCGLLYHQKVELSGDSSFSSLAMHLEDYKLALKAFLNRPICGNGYQNEAAIRAYMTSERLERNTGLSNSVAVILAEGGLMLGVICMLPFFLCFLKFRNIEEQRVALWAIGPFGLYCLTIFHFHMFLFMLMAFGYGLIEIKASEKNRLPELAFDRQNDAVDWSEERIRVSASCKKIVVLLCGIIVTLLLFSETFWRGCYTVLKRNQLYIGQSAWKPYFLALFIILIVLVTRFTIQNLQREIECKKSVGCEKNYFYSWKGYSIWFAFFSVIYIAVYPISYSWVSTLVENRFHGGDLIESFVLAMILFGGIVFGWWGLWCYSYVTRTGKRSLRWIPLVTTSLVIGALGICLVNAKERIQEDLSLPKGISEVLTETLSDGERVLFANELPLLIKKSIPGLHYSATRDGGFSAYKSISVLTRHNENFRELIDNGFEVAELSSDYLLYSNDSKMIQELTEKGYTFYKYFAFEQPINLRNLAAYNYGIFAGGEIRIEGDDSSIKHGPYDVIKNGEYTIKYQLHRKPQETLTHDLVGVLSVQSYYGKNRIKSREIYADEFDKQGDLNAELRFTAGDWEGMEYLALANENNAFQIKAITLKETPEYVVQKTYNGRKQVIKEAYFTLSGEPYIQTQGYASVTREYDRIGHVRTQRYFDVDNNPVRIRTGYARIDRYYDNNGRVIREEYFDEHNQLVTLPQGHAALEQGYDSEGHINDIRYYDVENRPVIIASGYARVHRWLNPDGKVLKETYYDDKGKALLLPLGYATCEFEYDNVGNAVVIRYLDENDKRIALSQNYAEIRREYDINRQIIRESYYDVDGNPVSVPQGYAINEREYDALGNAVVQRYFNAQGESVITTWNYAEVHRVFNSKHWTIEERYFGTDGEPIVLPQGYGLTEWQYDELGNPVTIKYYDIDKQPVLTTWGYAEIHREYNDKNQISKESYYDTNGQLMTMPQGYAFNEREYDVAGNASTQRYLDADGKRVMTTWNYAEVHREFNDKRQIVRESYFGADGEPVNMPQGYAVNERAYDEAGNVNLQRYCDASGTPVITTWNYAEVHRVYDELNRVIEESYYDAKGKPLTLPTGNAGVHREYNEKNQIIKETYYDTNGQLTTMPQGYSYNEREYDEAGNVSVQRYLDANEKPVITTWNYAEIHRIYDENRRIIQEQYYDVDGQPMVLPTGAAGDMRIYDEAGRLTVQKFVGLNGEPVMMTAGYAELHRSYNEKNQVSVENYCDTKSKPVLLPQGYTSSERSYDEAGNTNVQRYYGLDGKLVMTTWGYAEVHRVFNKKRQIMQESYFDTEGNPCYMSQGYALQNRGYDEVGNMNMQQFCDPTGKPVITTWNYAEVHRKYDDKRRIISESYYDTFGKPLMLPTGYAELRREYNDNNQIVKESYYDVDGKLVMTTMGYAEIQRDFDDKNQVILEKYYDAEGKEISK